MKQSQTQNTAPLGAPQKAAPLCSLFLIILYHIYLWIFLVCIFPIYFPYIFLWVLLNLFRQPYCIASGKLRLLRQD